MKNAPLPSPSSPRDTITNSTLSQQTNLVRAHGRFQTHRIGNIRQPGTRVFRVGGVHQHTKDSTPPFPLSLYKNYLNHLPTPPSGRKHVFHITWSTLNMHDVYIPEYIRFLTSAWVPVVWFAFSEPTYIHTVGTKQVTPSPCTYLANFLGCIRNQGLKNPFLGNWDLFHRVKYYSSQA